MDTIRSWLIGIIIIYFLSHSFFILPFGDQVLGVLTLILILFLLPLTQGFPRMISISMLIIGTILLFISGHYHDWYNSLTMNLPLIVLIMIVPIMAFPLQLGKYDEHISDFIRSYGSDSKKLFLSITSTFFFLGPIINLGSIRLMDNLLNKVELPKEFLAKVYMRGFTSTIVWSPFFAALLLVLFLVEVPLLLYLPFGLFLGLFHLLVANLLFTQESKKLPWEMKKGKEVNFKKIYELLFIFLVFFIFVFCFDLILPIKMIVVVTVSAITVASLWSLYLKQIRQFTKEINYYRRKTVLLSRNEIVLFITAGFFGSVISQTTVGASINQWISLISNVSILLFICSIILLTCLLALIGIHQIVTISAIATSIVPVDIGVHSIIFALVLMAAWTVATIVSPITPVNVILSSLIQKRFFDISIKWNGLFALIMIGIYSIGIYLIHLIIF